MITQELETLETASGMKMEFSAPLGHHLASKKTFSDVEQRFIQQEIRNLLKKGVLVQSNHEIGEFISPIFLVPKDENEFRMILNLRQLNEAMPYIHFKMDSFDKVIKLIRPGYFLCKIDIKEAYYSVPIHSSYQKYLKFEFQSVLYQFTCLPNGLCSGPRKFTKLLKPVLATLRTQGYIVSAFIDDIIIMDSSFDACIEATIATIKLLDALGFVINVKKSAFIPEKCIQYLGFIINTETMLITLPLSRREKIVDISNNLLTRSHITILEVASLVGLLVSTFPAVTFGPLYYRALERDKIIALKIAQGDFDQLMYLSEAAIADIHWWIDNINSSFNRITISNPDAVITTDASSLGWGAIFKDQSTRGIWNLSEQGCHINVLELKAILFGLSSLIHVQNIHIKILTDNMNAVHSISNMGSCRSSACNDVVRRIWLWAIRNNNWLSISHIPGIQNDAADAESRQHDLTTEWQLNPSSFKFLVRKLSCSVDIDLFASRVNYQMKPFVSFWPDPEALAVNAFTLDWSALNFYAFPPFSVIPNVLQKISSDEATGVLVVPDWPYSTWYSQFTRMLISECIILPCSIQLLRLPTRPDLSHPLHKTLRLKAGIVSGKTDYLQVFL